jgi:HK97 family phage major capsid protein
MNNPNNRGILRVNAAAAPGGVDLNALADGFEQFRSHYDARVDQLSNMVERTAADLSGLQVGAGGSSAPHRGQHVADPRYSAQFGRFLRSGENEPELRVANAVGRLAQIQASMSVGSNPDGGYLAPTEFDRQINQAQLAISPFRRLAKVVTTPLARFPLFGRSWSWKWLDRGNGR